MLLFMLMTACGASAQKGFFGSISRSRGVEYFYTAGVNRNNPNLKKGVPRIKGIDVEYLDLRECPGSRELTWNTL